MLNSADETGCVEMMSANRCSSLKHHELNPYGARTHACIHCINTDATPTPRQALFQAQRCIRKERDTRPLPIRKLHSMQWGWKDAKVHTKHFPLSKDTRSGGRLPVQFKRGKRDKHISSHL